MLFLFSIALLSASVFFALRAVTHRRLQAETVLGRVSGYGYAQSAVHAGDARRWLRALGRYAPGGRGEAAEALRVKIAGAGWARHVTPEDVAGLKVALPLGGFLLMALVGLAGMLPAALALPAGVVIAAFAYVGLPIVIDVRVRGRRDKIVGSLPIVLDLLTLSVETGMSFDAALQRLVLRLRGPLIDELQLTLREIQLGTTRNDALRALATRVDAPEVSSFVRALTQADRLGVPLAGLLRTQADELRARLRNEAEEHAMKAPVKMLFPTVLLIFPAVFIVILGPAMLTLMEVFS